MSNTTKPPQLIALDKSCLLAADKETSRDEILSKFLLDEAFANIALEGTDGIQVPANRYALAARSDVFYKMLLGDFAEANKEIIKIGYTGSVLKAIVEYVLTDTSSMLDDAKAAANAHADAIVTVTIEKPWGGMLGITLSEINDKIVLTRVKEGGLAAGTKLKLAAGMEIFSINGIELEGKSSPEAAGILIDAEGTIKIIALPYNSVGGDDEEGTKFNNLLQAAVASSAAAGDTAVDQEIVSSFEVDLVHNLISLAGAAVYFNFPLLCENTFNTLSQSIKNTPSLALCALDALNQQQEVDLSVPSMKTMAMSYLASCSSSHEAINPSVVTTLNQSTLEMVLSEKHHRMDEYLLFELISLWIDGSSTGCPTNSDDDEEEEATTGSRHTIGIQMMKSNIHLEWIDTKHLSAEVAASGFFTQEQLMEAYKNQALALQKASGMSPKEACLHVNN